MIAALHKSAIGFVSMILAVILANAHIYPGWALDKLDGKESVSKIQALLAENKLAEAEAEADRVSKLSPLCSSAFSPISDAYRDRGNSSEALRLLNKWVKYCPTGAAYASRASFYHKLERDDQALKDYGEALKREPMNFLYRDCRGRLLERTGHYKDSVADYDFLVKHNKNDPSLSHVGNRAVSLYRNGDYRAAIADANRALKAKHDDFLLSIRIDAYLALGEKEKALKDLNYYLSYKTKAVRQYVLRAEILEANGNLSGSRRDFDAAIKISPFNPAHYDERALLLKKMGKTAEADRDLLEAKKLRQLEKINAP